MVELRDGMALPAARQLASPVKAVCPANAGRVLSVKILARHNGQAEAGLETSQGQPVPAVFAAPAQIKLVGMHLAIAGSGAGGAVAVNAKAKIIAGGHRLRGQSGAEAPLRQIGRAHV